MTKEEKDLLLRDLCARLPYEVILVAPNGKITYQTDGNTGAELLVEEGFKPFLRPMSSMTEEECDIVEEILGDKCIFDFMSNGDIVLKQGQFSQNKLAKLYDYYTSIHVDYRGLIPMGLALEAPEGMYKIN